MRVCLSQLLATAALALSSSSFVSAAEKVLVLSPPSLVSKFSSSGGVINDVAAQFGMPPFQTSLYGSVYASQPLEACTALNASAITGLPNLAGVSAILYVDRGTCSFTTKVRNAGNAGFQSVIVGNNVDGQGPIIMGDDGTTPVVTTPSLMISTADAATLKMALHPSPPANHTNSTPPQPPVLMSITYTMPNPDNRVEWTLWTTSVDTTSKQFKHMFGSAAQALGVHALLTPYMWIDNWIDCADSNSCGNLCSNNGYYCAADPDGNRTAGRTGRDVVQENLRQLCLYDVLLYNVTGSPIYKWFDYIAEFDDKCGNACPGAESVDFYSLTDPNCNNGFSFNCSFAAMDRLKLPTHLVRACVNESGGYRATDGENYRLEEQLTQKGEQNINFIPAITVNSAHYSGSYNCERVFNTHTCSPLGAICAGFATNTAPPACFETLCQHAEVLDACGNCGGDGAVDGCGVCQSTSSPHFNASCRGCDGILHSTAKVDACGVCNGSGTRMGSCMSSGAIAAIFIVCICAAIAVGVGVWWYLRRQSRVMREDIDGLLKAYLPLESGPGSTNLGGADQRRRLVDSDDI